MGLPNLKVRFTVYMELGIHQRLVGIEWIKDAASGEVTQRRSTASSIPHRQDSAMEMR
jgi:hypothetical protein